MFAEVVVLSPVKPPAPGVTAPTFTYHLPDELEGRLAVPETRPVESLVDPDPVLTPAQIALARWMSREYLAPLHECLQLMLPPGVVGYTDVVLSPVGEIPPDAALTPAQRRLVALLQRRGPLRGAQLDRALPRTNWRATANTLIRRGLLSRTSFLAPPRARPRRVRTARLIPAADVDAALSGLRSEVYPAIVEFLRAEGGPVDVSWVYAETGCTRYHLDKLAERGLVAFDAEEVWRDPLAGQVFVPTAPPPLTPDQQAVWDISLTPQTVARFAARFPGRVAVLHSALTAGERYDTWRRARAGLVDVVIGPRSEEHDDSYKQEAPRPRYHARDVALELAHLTGATVILGSATPSLESYLRAQRGEFTLLKMPRRIMGHTRRLRDLQARYHLPRIRYHTLRDGPAEARPPVQIVDLRAELRAGNRSIFSRVLQRAMDEALGRGEQVILFLNRRGTATFVLCRDCGHVLRRSSYFSTAGEPPPSSSAATAATSCAARAVTLR